MLTCKLCGRHEGRDRYFKHQVGCYEFDVNLEKRREKYVVCSKCNRCYIKNSTYDNETFNKPGLRVVEF